MLCWNSLSIVSKRIGSARLLADELAAMLGTISSRSSVGDYCPALSKYQEFGDERRLFASGQENEEGKLTSGKMHALP